MSSIFSYRSNEQELMDDLQSEGFIIEQSLRELETINRWLGGNHVTIQAIRTLIGGDRKKVWRIIDIGCGGGDILRLIADWARRKKLKVELLGIDANPNVIKFAEEHSKEYPEISYKSINIFSAEFDRLPCDIITATLFTHHFSNEELVKLLRQFSRQAEVGIAINDLHRHWFAYRSINLLTSLFSKSPMVKNDAGVSVLRSFSKMDLTNLLEEAQIKRYTIKWMWAFRWQVIVW